MRCNEQIVHSPMWVRFFPATAEDRMDFDTKFLAYLGHAPVNTDRRGTSEKRQSSMK